MSRSARFICYATILACIALLKLKEKSVSMEPPVPAIGSLSPDRIIKSTPASATLSTLQLTKNRPAVGHTSGHNYRAIEAKLRREKSYLKSTTHADGTAFIDTNGTLQSGSMARRQSDGSLVVACFNKFDEAWNFLQTPDNSSPIKELSQTARPPLFER